MKSENIIKRIVSAVKSRDELKCVTCIYADSRVTAQNPVCNFTLCIGLHRIKYSRNPDTRNSELLTTIKLRLLAPSGAGGKRLCEMAVWISEAIRENLNVSFIEVTDPRFIDTSTTLYSDITVTVADENSENDFGEIYIDGVEERVVSCVVESTELSEKRPQLLNGYTVSNSGKKEIFIKLESKTALRFRENSDVMICTGDYKEILRNCRVKKAYRRITEFGALSFTYEIIAESTEVHSG